MCYLHLQRINVAPTYQTTRRHISENLNLSGHAIQSLRSTPNQKTNDSESKNTFAMLERGDLKLWKCDINKQFLSRILAFRHEGFSEIKQAVSDNNLK
jgi:hypothetical protein